MDPEYFQSDDELAAFIGLSVPAFLQLRNSGRFPVEARPRDPTPVYLRADVKLWLSEGRPVRMKRL